MADRRRTAPYVTVPSRAEVRLRHLEDQMRAELAGARLFGADADAALASKDEVDAVFTAVKRPVPRDHEEAAALVRDNVWARPASERLGPPRCECTTSIMLTSAASHRPARCSCCGRRIG